LPSFGPYQILSKLGEGGPPALTAACGRQLRRDPAVAQRGLRP
jgi:hypothetical protein